MGNALLQAEQRNLNFAYFYAEKHKNYDYDYVESQSQGSSLTLVLRQQDLFKELPGIQCDQRERRTWGF